MKLTPIAFLTEEYNRRSAAQDRINFWAATGKLSIADVVAVADAEHSQYPQYKGHWDGPTWVLVGVTVDHIDTTLGTAFRKGDITIARRSPISGEYTAYSIRNGIDTGLSWGVSPLTESKPFYLSFLQPGASDETGYCQVCEDDGACRDWVETMASDAHVPVEWLAKMIVDNAVDNGWSVLEVEELYGEHTARFMMFGPQEPPQEGA